MQVVSRQVISLIRDKLFPDRYLLRVTAYYYQYCLLFSVALFVSGCTNWLPVVHTGYPETTCEQFLVQTGYQETTCEQFLVHTGYQETTCEQFLVHTGYQETTCEQFLVHTGYPETT